MPISDCQVRDPRIRRTRKLLQEALGGLMRSKGFDDISVHDIAEAATVNRATFYDHYTDKFALLDAMVAGGFHELLAQRAVRYDAGCPGALTAIIQTTCDFLTRVHAGGGCDRQTHFEPLMDEAIRAAIRRLLLEGLARDARDTTLPAELVAAAASAAICSGVKQWIATPDRPDTGVLVPQLLALVFPMLQVTSIAESPNAVPEHHSTLPLPETLAR